MIPLKLRPEFKDYIWGGNRLNNILDMKSGFEKTAEAWLLSCHDDGLCKIENGKFKGMTLRDVINGSPWLAGYECSDVFPIIVKLIDAADNLSVQVHPSGENCKNEMWYVLDCEKDSYIFLGFKKNISRKNCEMHINNGTVTSLMNKISVNKGDVFYIKSGTFHAIGKGILVAEIQQNSNITYRVYDYDRTDENGNKRTLNIDKALDSADFSRQKEIYQKTFIRNGVTVLNEGDFFNVYKLDISSEKIIFNNKSSFSHITIIEGNGTVSDYTNNYSVNFKKGNSFFLSAGYSYKIKGKSEIILTTKCRSVFENSVS